MMDGDGDATYPQVNAKELLSRMGFLRQTEEEDEEIGLDQNGWRR